jgi:glycosyltransferase involved in cell wall biosynthesis
MRLGLDCRRQTNDGVGRVTSMLVETLSTMVDVDLVLYGPVDLLNRMARTNNIINAPKEIFALEYLDRLPSLVTQEQIDIFVGPQFYCIASLPCKVINILHDAIPFKPSSYLPTLSTLESEFGATTIRRYARESGITYSEEMSVRELYYALYQRCIAVANEVATVSRISKDDLTHFFPQLEQRLEILPLYAGLSSEATTASWTRPYFLTVGASDPRKRIREVVRAIALARHWGADIDLLIVGKDWELHREYSEALHRDIENVGAAHVKWLTSVTDTQLSLLYRNALATILVSDYEGFGLPLIEAMSAACPLITTGHGAMAEVCDAADLRIGSDNLVTNLATAMLRVVTEPDLRVHLSEESSIRGLAFTEDRFASALQHIITRTLTGPP